MNEGILAAQNIIDRLLDKLKWMPEDERHQVNLSKNEVVCLNNLLTIAKAQDNTGKVIERELQNTLMRADKRMQKFIKSAKMVYKMGSCSDVPCADCPWYNEHMHSTFRAEPDYDRSELDSKNARRRAAARWLIAHDITEVDGEPIVVEPPQILEPQKKDKE